MAGAFTGWSARQGLATAGSVTLAVWVGAYLGQQDLWWAAISAWIVSNPDFGALWRKLAMRIAGTAFGLLIGFFLSVAIQGQPALQAIAFFAVCAFGPYQRFSSAYGYAWFYGAITIAMLLAVSIVAPKTLFAFAQYRFPEIVTGALASAFVHALVRPGDAAAPPKPTELAPRDRALFRVALVGGFSGVGVTLVWLAFALPSLPQGLISTLVLIDSDTSNIRVRGRQRFLGCALGALLGLACVGVGLDAEPVYFATLFAGIFYLSRTHHGGGPSSYIGTQGGVAFITAMVTGRGPPSSILPAVERLAGILIGVTLMTGVALVLSALAAPPRAVSASGEIQPEIL
jgi:uncharacterized membrane protein YccC